eukprot:1102908-Karenia_brevis.AAC.1
MNAVMNIALVHAWRPSSQTSHAIQHHRVVIVEYTLDVPVNKLVLFVVCQPDCANAAKHLRCFEGGQWQSVAPLFDERLPSEKQN